jgi:CxxC-x17-CxxC domain-containing protein
MSYQDRSLTCQDCGQTFAFSVDDQEFHAEKGYNDPKRCLPCRQARRSQRGQGGYGGSERQMYPAVCDDCGKETEVPFQPRGDRPVYCSDCFRREPVGSSRRY